MSKLAVRCDVDGVLADLVTKLCDALNYRGHTVFPADIKHHSFAKVMTPAALKAASEIMSQPGFCWGLPWHAGARDFLERIQLAGDDYELLIVTAPWEKSPSWNSERKDWLATAGIPRADVLSVASARKKYVQGDVLIEDHAGTLHDWLVENPNGRGILIDQPWNQETSDEYKFHPRIYRIANIENAFLCLEGFRRFDQNQQQAA